MGGPNPGQYSGDGESKDRTDVLYPGRAAATVTEGRYEGSLGGLTEGVTNKHTIYGKDKQATRPERLAEPDLGSLAFVFQMLYTHLHKSRKEVALVATGVEDWFFYPIGFHPGSNFQSSSKAEHSLEVIAVSKRGN